MRPGVVGVFREYAQLRWLSPQKRQVFGPIRRMRRSKKPSPPAVSMDFSSPLLRRTFCPAARRWRIRFARSSSARRRALRFFPAAIDEVLNHPDPDPRTRGEQSCVPWFWQSGGGAEKKSPCRRMCRIRGDASHHRRFRVRPVVEVDGIDLVRPSSIVAAMQAYFERSCRCDPDSKCYAGQMPWRKCLTRCS